jgi:large subunit ribosomal protein L20
MPRVKRGVIAHKKREKVLKQTKGFKWTRKSKERAAKEALLHSLAMSFVGRKEKKREYRRLWNVQINAAARLNGLKYSDLIHSMKLKTSLLTAKSSPVSPKTSPRFSKKLWKW